LLIGDGELEVVLIPGAHKEKFSDYLLHKLADGDDPYQFHTLKAKTIKIRWDGTRLHADDEMLKLERQTEVMIQIQEGALQFVVPGESVTRQNN
jgi:diacylglycerol kinase family enzyme